eukprot:scaffold239625_cov32-Prasinocladus_malaysianus.AAC.1
MWGRDSAVCGLASLRPDLATEIVVGMVPVVFAAVVAIAAVSCAIDVAHCGSACILLLRVPPIGAEMRRNIPLPSRLRISFHQTYDYNDDFSHPFCSYTEEYLVC